MMTTMIGSDSAVKCNSTNTLFLFVCFFGVLLLFSFVFSLQYPVGESGTGPAPVLYLGGAVNITSCDASPGVYVPHYLI